VVTLFSLAGIFVLLEAQFIAVLQVLVYAGAINGAVPVSVIMLLNLGARAGPSDLKGRSASRGDHSRGRPDAAAAPARQRGTAHGGWRCRRARSARCNSSRAWWGWWRGRCSRRT